jgi:hypothetical protein
MSIASDQHAAARREAMVRMQSRWGQVRNEPGKSGRAEDESVEMALLELDDEDLDLALRVPTPSHLSELKEALRALRAERFAELREPGDPSQGTASRRRELYEEITSEHFRKGMASWLTSIAPDHGFSATPADELEKIRDEMLYRLRLVKAIAGMMQRELDALENQIRARRTIEARKENS